jgi:hypothetical protein
MPLVQQNATDYDPRQVLQTQGPAALPLDAAVEYIRHHGLRLLPLYLISMAPISIIALFLIDAITAQHRSVLSAWCWALVPATLWRWVWLAKIQQLIQRDLQSRPGLRLRSRLLWILVARLYANVAFTWGSFIIAPSFYGLFAGSFAAPLLLERDGPLLRESFQVLRWIHHSAGRLMRVSIALSFLMLILTLAAFIVQYILVQTVLPGFLDVDTTSLGITMSSTAWRLTLLYFVTLLFDFFWTVASVFLYYDSQSRRTGSDLRARMSTLRSPERSAA